MKKFNFLQKLDSLKEFVDEDKVLEIYTEAEEVFSDFDEKIDELKDEVEEKEKEIKDLKEEVEGFEERVEELEANPNFNIENQIHNNIRTIGVLEDLFRNLDYIAIDELETLVKKHAVL